MTNRRSAARAVLLAATAVGVLGFFVCPDPVRGRTTDPRLEKILADWQKRQVTPEHVRYRVRGERVFPSGSFRDDRGKPFVPPRPPSNVRLPKEWSLLVDFREKRFRHEAELHSYQESNGKILREYELRAYDGKTYRSHRPKERNDAATSGPAYFEVEGNLSLTAFDPAYNPIFAAHGLVTMLGVEVTADNLKWTHNPADYYVHGEGVHDGRACVIVRSQSFKRVGDVCDEYWVDPGRDSAVVRQIWLNGDKPTKDWDIKYQRTPAGWLPESWVFTWRQSGVTTAIETMRVTELSTDPTFTIDDFRPPPLAGSVIGAVTMGDPKTPGDKQHPTIEERRFFRVSAGGQREEIPSADAVTPGWGRYAWWLTAVSAVILAVWVIARRTVARPART